MLTSYESWACFTFIHVLVNTMKNGPRVHDISVYIDTEIVWLLKWQLQIIHEVWSLRSLSLNNDINIHLDWGLYHVERDMI